MLVIMRKLKRDGSGHTRIREGAPIQRMIESSESIEKKHGDKTERSGKVQHGKG